MTNEERVAAARQALENPAIQEAFHDLEQAYLERLLNLGPLSHRRRFLYSEAINILRQVQHSLVMTVETAEAQDKLTTRIV